MEGSDEVDFTSKFTVYDEDKKEVVSVGLSQRQMMLIFIVLLAIVFFILAAFGAVEVKDLVELKALVKDIAKDLND